VSNEIVLGPGFISGQFSFSERGDEIQTSVCAASNQLIALELGKIYIMLKWDTRLN